MAGRIRSLYNDSFTATTYVRPELLALPEVMLESYLEDEAMENYHMMLERIMIMKAHTIRKEEEYLLALIPSPKSQLCRPVSRMPGIFRPARRPR